jgi:hypothetical protein
MFKCFADARCADIHAWEGHIDGVLRSPIVPPAHGWGWRLVRSARRHHDLGDLNNLLPLKLSTVYEGPARRVSRSSITTWGISLKAKDNMAKR